MEIYAVSRKTTGFEAQPGEPMIKLWNVIAVQNN
jgi:hypothetical protein